MIKIYTQSKIDKIKEEVRKQTVVNFIDNKVPEYQRRAVEDFQIEQARFASMVDSQPKVVWNDQPVYFNFPPESTVISITRVNYGSEDEKTLVHLMINGFINELFYGICREDHKELIENFMKPETKVVKKRK